MMPDYEDYQVNPIYAIDRVTQEPQDEDDDED